MSIRIRNNYLGFLPEGGGLRTHETVAIQELTDRLLLGDPLFEYITAEDIVRLCWDTDSYPPQGTEPEQHAEHILAVAKDSIRLQLDRFLPQLGLTAGDQLDLAIASRHGEVPAKSKNAPFGATRTKVSFRFYLQGARIRWADMKHLITRCNPKVCFAESGDAIALFDDIYSSERHLGCILCPKTKEDPRILQTETEHGFEAFIAQHTDPFWPLLAVQPKELDDGISVSQTTPMTTTEAPTVLSDRSLRHVPESITKENAQTLLALVLDSTFASYVDWRNLAMACHSNEGEDLWAVFDERCQIAPGYDGPGNRKIWDAFLPDGAVTIRTLFWYAKRDSPTEFKRFLKHFQGIAGHPCIELFDEYGATDATIAVSSAQLFPRFRACGKNWFEFKAPRWSKVDPAVIKKHFGGELYKTWCEAAALCSTLSGNAPEEHLKKRWNELNLALKRHSANLLSAPGKERILCELRTHILDPRLDERMDADPTIIGFEDFVWDWKLNGGTGGFREGTAEDYVSFSTGYKAPLEELSSEERADIERFFAPIYPDPEVRRFVLGAFRRSLDGRIPRLDHNFWLLTGLGGGGKSAVMNLLMKSLGDYACKIPITMLCNKRPVHTAADCYMYALKGRRLIVASEPDHTFKDRLNGSLIKEISGGEVVSARPLYGEPVSFICQGWVWIQANNCLELDGADTGIERRVKVIRHIAQFRRGLEDAHPDLHIYPQNDTVLLRVMELTPKLMRMLLFLPSENEIPPTVLQWTQSYMDQYNPIATFVKDQLERGAIDDVVTLSALRYTFGGWIREHFPHLKIGVAELKAGLTRELGACHEQKWIKGSNMKNCFIGWKMKPVE